MNPLLDHTDSSKVHWPRKNKFARKAKSTNEDQVEKFQARALLQHVRKYEILVEPKLFSDQQRTSKIIWESIGTQE